MELEECIKDALETSMKEYAQSDEYKNQSKDISSAITQLREDLTTVQQKQLNSLLDKITNCHSNFAAEAYKNGVVDGIELSARRKLEA